MNKIIHWILSPYVGINWKKIIRNWLIIAAIIFSLTLYGVFAYNSSNLVVYYSFETTTGSQVSDSVSSYLWNQTYGAGTLITVNGIQGNALTSSGTALISGLAKSVPNMSYDFTLNYWLNVTNASATEGESVFLKYGISPYLEQHCTYPNRWSNFSSCTISNAVLTDYCTGAVNFQPNTWHMYTITHNASTNRTILYVDKSVVCNYTSPPLPYSYTTNIGIWTRYLQVDEFSLWNTTLTQSDINYMYVNNTYNAVGNPITILNNFCMDDNHLCVYGYYNSQTLNYTCYYTPTTCSGSCVVDMTGSYCSESPPVTVTEQTWFDICIPGNILCHNLMVNLTDGSIQSYYCPISYSGSLNKEYCVNFACIDNQTYWDAVNGEPANLNYSGYCGWNNQSCIENKTRCYDDYTIETCRAPSYGLSYWYKSGTCNSGYKCNRLSGSCEWISNATAQGTDIGELTSSDQEMWDGFFGISSDTSNNRLMIALVSIAILTLALTGVMIGLSTAAGRPTPLILNVGVVGAGFVMSVLYFISIGFIPFWVLLITIAIVALITAGWFTRKPIPGG